MPFWDLISIRWFVKIIWILKNLRSFFLSWCLDFSLWFVYFSEVTKLLLIAGQAAEWLPHTRHSIIIAHLLWASRVKLLPVYWGLSRLAAEDIRRSSSHQFLIVIFIDNILSILKYSILVDFFDGSALAFQFLNTVLHKLFFQFIVLSCLLLRTLNLNRACMWL